MQGENLVTGKECSGSGAGIGWGVGGLLEKKGFGGLKRLESLCGFHRVRPAKPRIMRYLGKDCSQQHGISMSGTVENGSKVERSRDSQGGGCKPVAGKDSLADILVNCFTR